MKCWLDKTNVLVQGTYDEREIIKAIGNYKLDKAYYPWAWRFPMSSLISIIENLKVDFDDSIQQAYNQAKIEQAELEKKYVKAQEIKEGKIDKSKYEGSNLFFHQKQALQLAELHNSYALYLEMGLGKSRCAIELIKERKPAMIVAPLSTLEPVWASELKKWSSLSFVNLWHNLDAFKENYDVYLINYAHLKLLAKDVKIEDKIKFIVIDESSALKNFKSDRTKLILSYHDKIPYRLLLSGNPFPNSLLESWPQGFFLNTQILSDNAYKFRNRFFYASGYGGYTYLPFKDAKEEIMRQLAKHSFFCKQEDCLDLPETITEIRHIEMDKVQAEKYQEMLKENVVEFGSQVSLAPNELSKILKLREITSGFVYSSEGLAIKIAETKLNELKNILDEIGSEHQVIIWANFKYEIKMISEALKGCCAILHGGLNQAEKNLNIQVFKDGKLPYLVSHPMVGGFGLNLENANYCIWFSLSYSAEQLNQANARIRRPSQKKPCVYVYMLATRNGKRTIDQVIYKCLIGKKSLSDSCLQMLTERRG